MAPIITAHIRQTATTSLNDHLASIGIVSAISGADMFEMDHAMIVQPRTHRRTRKAKPFRRSGPVGTILFTKLADT